MQNRQRFLDLRWWFLCAVMFSLVGDVLSQNYGLPPATVDPDSAMGRAAADRARSITPSWLQELSEQRPGRRSGGATGGGASTESIGTVDSNRGGVFIHPSGVMARFSAFDAGALTRQQLNVVKAIYLLPGDVSAESPMRCISLNRLEKAIIEANGEISDEMWYLAGIQRVRYVFYYSETRDIVIAGYTEGWSPGYEGTMIGTKTGQPVCELQDLVMALRVYAPGKEVTEVVGCSIDPTPEGNVRLQQFVDQFCVGNTPAQRQAFIDGIRQSIGLQTVRVNGVPATTHAARIMVAADYRMKRIGLGADDKPVRQLTTFIEKTVPNAPDAAFRWFFVPDYESVILTEDRTGLQLVGDGVKLVGENEIVSSMGERSIVRGKLDPGSAAFTKSFTQQYPRIAERALVFAQLRNWIDMLICAAHIQREDFYGKSGWSMECFGNEEKFPLEVYAAPQNVEPLVGTVRRGNLLLAPVGGGVVIDAELALDVENAKPDTGGKIAEKRAKIGLNLPEGVWWWDVK